MKGTQLTNIILCCLASLTISVARGQFNPDDGRLILYETDRMPGKYVLSMCSAPTEKGETSLVVIGDTFSVQLHRATCWVVMTNAYILQTTFGHSPSNEVSQVKMKFDVYRLNFPEHTKLLFNGSVVELPKVKIGAPAGEADAKIYEGEDALRQMKKMGLEPPDDMDLDKAEGKKQK